MFGSTACSPSGKGHGTTRRCWLCGAKACRRACDAACGNWQSAMSCTSPLTTSVAAWRWRNTSQPRMSMRQVLTLAVAVPLPGVCVCARTHTYTYARARICACAGSRCEYGQRCNTGAKGQEARALCAELGCVCHDCYRACFLLSAFGIASRRQGLCFAACSSALSRFVPTSTCTIPGPGL